MKTIDQDIRENTIKRVYLFYGEETYLILQYRNKLKKAMIPEDDEVNFSYYEGEGISENEIIDQAETMPFFADRRVLLIENSGWFRLKGKGVTEELTGRLAAYIPTIPESACLIFVEKEVDRRSKVYKAVAKTGSAVEFKTQTEETLAKWVLGRVHKEGKTITQEAYQQFIRRVGFSMENIQKELEKLLCYTLDKDTIAVEDVNAVTTEQIQNKIFDMVDAIASHQQRKALDYYYDLLALKEPPMRILYLITRQFHTLAIVKSMKQQGYGNKDIAAKAGCPEWAVRKYWTQCREYSLEQLKKAVRDGTEYEEDVKTGKLDDRMAVELFIVEYAKNPPT